MNFFFVVNTLKAFLTCCVNRKKCFQILFPAVLGVVVVVGCSAVGGAGAGVGAVLVIVVVIDGVGSAAFIAVAVVVGC